MQSNAVSRHDDARDGAFPARAVAVITLAALGLRLLLLARQPLWRDEVFTAVVVRRPLGGMFDALRADSGAPLAYLLTHGLTALFGVSPLTLRAVSVLAGTAAVPVAAALALRLGGRHAAVGAAAFTALAPSFIVSARDARMYALATTTVMAALLLLWRAAERPSMLRLTACAAVVGIAVNTQYLAAPAVIAQALAVLVVLRPSPATAVRIALALAAGGASLLPWLWVAHGQTAHLDAAFWTGPVDARHIAGMVAEFLNGPRVEGGIDGATAVTAGEAAAVASGVLGILGAARWWRGASATGRRSAVVILGAVLGGWLLLVLVSLRVSFIEARYASVFWGPLTAVVGTGLTALPWRWLRGVAVSLVGGGAAVMVGIGIHPEGPALASQLPAQLGAHDVVLADPGDYLLLLWSEPASQLQQVHVVGSSIPWWWGVAAFPPTALVPTTPPDTLEGRGTIYAVAAPGTPPPPEAPGYRLGAASCRSQVCVSTWVPAPGT